MTFDFKINIIILFISMEQNIQNNLNKFREYNNLKIEKTLNNLGEVEKDFIKLIPFLLHTNIKGLPGYIDSKNLPIGIKNYNVNDEIIQIVKKRFPLIKLPTSINSNELIESISIMGSIGSIAQNKNSDFDYWVCIEKNKFDKDSYYLFTEKLKSIEKWFLENNGLEIHFFPTDIKEARNSKFGEFEGESCGSAQGDLLKDEYFRSSIVVDGKVPFWWVISPNTDNESYNKMFAALNNNNDFIDLGNLSKINKGEFFGAALWHMIKSLDNPFKSFIKISLIDKYINTEKQTSLLCNILKRNVLSNNFNVKAIDAYILMYEYIYDYYEQTENWKLLDILRKCFYLKIQPELLIYKNYPDEKLPEKTLIMKEYIRKWKWSEKEVEELDNFNKWSFDKLLKINKELKKHMINNFMKFSDYFKNIKIDYNITDRDMTIIGRKLISYFTGKPSKIDYFYISLSDKPYEDIISIKYNELEQTWELYRGPVTRISNSIMFESKIMETKYLLDILVWLVYNSLYNPYRTKINLFGYHLKINFNDIINFLNTIKEFIKDKKEIIKNEYYLEKPFIIKCLIVINFESVSFEEIETISFIIMNSYGEVYVKHFRSQNEFILLIKEIFENFLKTNFAFNYYFKFFTFKGNYQISEYWIKLINNINRSLFDKKYLGDENRVFITTYSDSYLIFYTLQNKVFIHQTKNFFEILELYTKFPLKKTFTITENTKDNKLELLKMIYDTSKFDEFDFFIYNQNNNSIIIFLNDNFNLMNLIYCTNENFISIIQSFKKIIKSRNEEIEKERAINKFCFKKFIEPKFFAVKLLKNNNFIIEEIKEKIF